MSCPTAQALFEDYSIAAMEHSEATVDRECGRHDVVRIYLPEGISAQAIQR